MNGPQTRGRPARQGSSGIRRALPALLLVVWAPILPGCDTANSATQQPTGTETNPASPVRVATVEVHPAPLALRAIGTVEALASVTIRSQIDGRLTKANFVDGQEVREGDMLFEIDPRPSQAALALARADLERDQALALDAKREAQRVARLFAAHNAADRERDQAQADEDAKAAQVRADQAKVEQAELELEYCTIRSPLNGRVGARLADPGNIVKENDTPLLVLKQVKPIYVTFSVAERHLADIRHYASEQPLVVEARFPDGNADPELGTLTFTDNQVDRSTGMVRLKGTFANEDGRMWPGQYVNVSLILTTRPDAIVVPTKAVQAGPSGQFVFVVKSDRTVEMRPVQIADALDGLTVVKTGLSAGEQVVTDGQLRLTPDASVRILSTSTGGADRPADDGAAAASGNGA